LKQLSLFDENGEPTPPGQQQSQQGELPGQNEPSPFDLLLQRCQKNTMHLRATDIDAMRAWLLQWGKLHDYPAFSFPFVLGDELDRRVGLLYYGEARWKADLQPPHSQHEYYAGEWLVKAIEHVRRFDSGQFHIPEQISQQKRVHHSKEDEE
jgi:hypothetical protein